MGHTHFFVIPLCFACRWQFFCLHHISCTECHSKCCSAAPFYLQSVAFQSYSAQTQVSGLLQGRRYAAHIHYSGPTVETQGMWKGSQDLHWGQTVIVSLCVSVSSYSSASFFSSAGIRPGLVGWDTSDSDHPPVIASAQFSYFAVQKL